MKLLKNIADYMELAGTIQEALPSIEDGDQMQKAVDYQVQSIAGRQISMYDGLLKKKQQQLDDAVRKLKEALETHSQGASEVADNNVIRNLSWVKQNEEQLAFLEEYVGPDLIAAKDAFKEFFDKSWVPYSEGQNLTAKMSQTAARAEAEALLARFK